MSDFDRSEDYAEALKALSASERIDILSYLKEEEETTMEELSVHMEALGYENATLQLFHRDLLILQDYGVLDMGDELIEYSGDEVIEDIMETIEEM